VADPKTEEMHVDQLTREAGEREDARAAELRGEAHQHERRADKAAYLRSKLADRARSEDETEG
jgi:hypothetical protein